MSKPVRDEVRRMIEELHRSTEAPDCYSCECLQAFLAQIEIDAADDIRDLIEPLKVSPRNTHRCRGCTPCAPAEHYTSYLGSRTDPT